MKTPQVEVETLPHDPISLCSSSSATSGGFERGFIWIRFIPGSNLSSHRQNRFAKHFPPWALCLWKQMLNGSSHLFHAHEYLNIPFLTSVSPPELSATCFLCWFKLRCCRFTTGAHVLDYNITMQEEKKRHSPKTFQYCQKTASGDVSRRLTKCEWIDVSLRYLQLSLIFLFFCRIRSRLLNT